MKTVHEVSELAGVSIRTLQYYDSIGLLKPAVRTEAGYRLYDEQCLGRLRQVLLYRELEFSLKDIRQIVDSPDFDQRRALDQQIELLELRRAHVDRLIAMAQAMREGTGAVSFEPFDTSVFDARSAQAKAAWGTTPEWQEYERISAGRSREDERALGEELLALFVPFGQMAAAGIDPASDEAAAQARRVQDFITAHYYHCTNEIFGHLGRAYGCGGGFTQSINEAAGVGAAEFASQAVEAYVTRA